MRQPLRILVLEDVEDDFLLVARALRKAIGECLIERVDTPVALGEKLEQPWDLILSDWNMPHLSALEAIEMLQALDLDIPFVLVSGTIGEELAVEVMRRGAKDYLLKDKLGRLGAVVEREIEEHRERVDRRQAELDLRDSENRYRLLFEANPLPMWVHDPQTLEFLAVNEATVAHYGYSREEFYRLRLGDVVLPDPPSATNSARHKTKSGDIISVEVTSHDLPFAGRGGRLVLINDVTARKQLEDQLRQAQKMEAIGKLAGGVAHDFNNLLAVVIIYADMLLRDALPGQPTYAELEEILKAAKRGAALTNQLLAFSRQQVMIPRIINLNEQISSLAKMLHRIIGEDIELKLVLAADLGLVKSDGGQLEQVVMNLAINARDAMPKGGKLTIETANVAIDESVAKVHPGFASGDYVMLAVSDTGVGMDRATQARIFEPFFTTKEQGKGTGLGLATVIGIVQQSGGQVLVHSEPGLGTTFKIYLPRTNEVGTPVSGPKIDITTLSGTESILLVEDDDQFRRGVVDTLRRFGYRVKEAKSPSEALSFAKDPTLKIDLLLSDVIMPEMGGPDLAAKLTKSRGQLRVLCMSGYTGEAMRHHGFIESNFAFLQKPFTLEGLARKIREVLSEPGGG